MLAQVSEAPSLQIKTSFSSEQLPNLPAVVAEIRAALAEMPVGRVTLTLDDLEAQWAADRLGLIGVKCLTVEFDGAALAQVDPPESPFNITGAP